MSLDAEVIRNVLKVRHVTTVFVKMLAIWKMLVDQMHFVNSKTIVFHVNVQLVSKAIQHRNKDAFVYLLHV